MAIVLDDVTRRLLDGRNFATVATLNPDGGPQTSVVWILRDGDTVNQRLLGLILPSFLPSAERSRCRPDLPMSGP